MDFKELSSNSIAICKWGHVFSAKDVLHPFCYLLIQVRLSLFYTA